MTSPSKTARNKRRFLELILLGKTISGACRKAKIGRTTYYKWMKDDPVFAEQFEVAQRKSQNDLTSIQEEPLSEPNEWKEKFLRFYVEYGGSFPDVCEAAHVSLAAVMAAVEPDSDVYDKEFAEAIERLETHIVKIAEGRVLRNILVGGKGSGTDAKWWLAKVQPEKYGDKSTVVTEQKLDVEGINKAAREILESVFGPQQPAIDVGSSGRSKSLRPANGEAGGPGS